MNADMAIDKDILGMWYVTMRAGDWMGTVQPGEGGCFLIQYRFRYYKDDKAFDSEDVKSWYRAQAPDAEIALKAMGNMARMIRDDRGGKMWELLRGTGSEADFLKQILALPFVHHKVVPLHG